jgi:predicted peptidase
MRHLLPLLMALTIPLAAQAAETGFLNRSVTLDGTAYRYQVYVPYGWTSAGKWPVILSLHGAGERGDDGLAQTQVGIGAAIRLHPDRYPAIVVMPQVRADLSWQDPRMEAQALAALDQATREFNADPDRVYLTGLSMGGFGSWSLLAKYHGKFAAAAIICGGVAGLGSLPSAVPESGNDLYSEAAKRVGAEIPIWLFHGNADMRVPVEESRRMSESLKSIGSNVRYTEYEGVGHNSWDKAYAEPDLPKWMLEQRLKANASKEASRR